MDQDTHTVTTNIINLLIAALQTIISSPWPHKLILAGPPLPCLLTAKTPDFKVLSHSHDNHFVRTILSSQDAVTNPCTHQIN